MKKQSELYQPIFERVQKFISGCKDSKNPLVSQIEPGYKYISLMYDVGYLTVQEYSRLDMLLFDKEVELQLSEG